MSMSSVKSLFLFTRHLRHQNYAGLNFFQGEALINRTEAGQPISSYKILMWTDLQLVNSYWSYPAVISKREVFESVGGYRNFAIRFKGIQCRVFSSDLDFLTNILVKISVSRNISLKEKEHRRHSIKFLVPLNTINISRPFTSIDWTNTFIQYYITEIWTG